MAKFAVGQRVEIGFNPPRPDLRVPNQANGVSPGRGDFQTKPDQGVILEVREPGPFYLVEVELEAVHGNRVVKSFRKRVVSEEKLGELK